jgi:hypothetical protein
MRSARRWAETGNRHRRAQRTRFLTPRHPNSQKGSIDFGNAASSTPEWDSMALGRSRSSEEACGLVAHKYHERRGDCGALPRRRAETIPEKVVDYLLLTIGRQVSVFYQQAKTPNRRRFLSGVFFFCGACVLIRRHMRGSLRLV